MPEVNIDLGDIQALIVRGYNSLNAARYVPFQINDVLKAREFLQRFADNYVTASDKSSWTHKTDAGDPCRAAHIAFTSFGLDKLDVSKETMLGFSREFREGMNYQSNPDNGPNERSTLLGDILSNDPNSWAWGNGQQYPHGILLFYAVDEKDLELFYNEVMKDSDLSIIDIPHAHVYREGVSKEHFGFADGLSQPVIKGLAKAKLNPDEPVQLELGEFVLGYKNEYGIIPPSPSLIDTENIFDLPFVNGDAQKKDFGKNGSYLVFRQMHQNVASFWNYMLEHSKENGVSRSAMAVKLASKMMGRWPDGQPLTLNPDYKTSVSPKDINRFVYTGVDADGFRCPFGAHIRRANPRDQVHTGRSESDSSEMSRRHRMLRRGRIYGDPVHESFEVDKIMDLVCIKEPAGREQIVECHQTQNEASVKIEQFDTKERGLHFICLISDISRQFEFVQSVWSNTPTFGDLTEEVDPIISQRLKIDDRICQSFTAPGFPVRNRYNNLPHFTKVMGGGYFFMPGIRALKALAKGIPDTAPTTKLTDSAEIVSNRIIGYLRKVLLRKYKNKEVKRAFHAKTIGLVRGVMTVNEGLEDRFRKGLFSEEKSYNVLVRFSNASPKPSADINKAIRGMAIKVFVDEPKKIVNDIILTNAEIFFSGDANKQMTGAKIAVGNFWQKLIAGAVILVTFPQRAIRFLQQRIRTPQVLEEKYFSATPYKFGKEEVLKWIAEPDITHDKLLPAEPKPDFLRKRLDQFLSNKEAIFNLYVQLQRDAENQPIEDPFVVWTSKPHPVAKIRLFKEQINTEDRNQLDKSVSFSPGNSIPEHAPLGALNAIRACVYSTLAEERIKGGTDE